MCNVSERLGRTDGLREIRTHPWLAGYDFEGLRSARAPFVPEIKAKLEPTLERLRTMPSSDPAFAPLVQELTANFDDFPDHPLPGARDASGAGVRRDKDNKFIGYTYKRAAKVRVPLGDDDDDEGDGGGGGGSSIFAAGQKR